MEKYITKFVVNLIDIVYYYMQLSICMAIVNLIGIVSVLALAISRSSIIFFLLPLILLGTSLPPLFEMFDKNERVHVFKSYFYYYRKWLKDGSKLTLIFLGIFLVLFLDYRILTTSTGIKFMGIPLLITSIYIFSSIIFGYILLLTKVERNLTVLNIFKHSVYLSYAHPIVTIINGCYMLIIVLLFVIRPLELIFVFGTGISMLIFKNTSKTINKLILDEDSVT